MTQSTPPKLEKQKKAESNPPAGGLCTPPCCSCDGPASLGLGAPIWFCGLRAAAAADQNSATVWVPNDPSTDWYASRVEERPAWLTRAVGLGRAEVWAPAGEGVRANCILAREIWEAEGSVWGGRGGGPVVGAWAKEGGKLGEAKPK